MRIVLKKIIKQGFEEKEQRVVVCDICGDIWPLYEHGEPKWLDYNGKIQCVKHCPEALELTSKNENILKQLLYYNREIQKVQYKGVCPECGISFIKNFKSITCSIACSNKFFKKGSHNFIPKKVLTEEELKDIEEFKKDLGEII